MTTTTDHPLARVTVLTLKSVADRLEAEWSRTCGIPEVLADATAQDTLTRIVCERALSDAGVDVFWNDLVCSKPAQAANAVRGVADRGVDLEALYGPMYEALLGLLKGCVLMDAQMIASLGYQLTGRSYSLDYDTVRLLARGHDVERLLDRVWSDVQVACHKTHLDSQSAMERHLKGVRAAELTAAYYVLKGEGVVLEHALEQRLTHARARTCFLRSLGCRFPTTSYGYPTKLWMSVGPSQYNRSTTTDNDSRR